MSDKADEALERSFELRRRAADLPPGEERDALLAEARRVRLEAGIAEEIDLGEEK